MEKKKLQTLKQNLRTKYGLVDFLAQDGSTMVVVKVCSEDKSRGSLIEALTVSEREKYILLLHELMTSYQTNCARVDLAITSNAVESPKSNYYKGIIEFNR